MIRGFELGGEFWRVELVAPSSPFLIDRTGKLAIATTDTAEHVVRVSNAIHGELLDRVLIHECAHCALHVYGIDERLARLIPSWHRVEVEELVCNIIAEFGFEVLQAARDVRTAVRAIEGRVLEFAA